MFYRTENDCTILYGRFKTRETGTYEIIDVKLEGQSFSAETNISKGTVNASLITPRELFIEALQKNAVSIIILHNHPSGDPTPSREDMLTTKRILDAGALIGIDLLDHIIIGNNCYMSFREEGML